ncbi:MAG: UDP-3-O-(3-hydroxymyristoyl)glucosamine N-acyltransferase [Bacteroidota bacterium]
MEFTIGEIAGLLGGTVSGEATAKVRTVAKIQEAGPGSIAFLSNPKYEQYIYNTQASAVIVNNSFVPKEPVAASLILVEDAYSAFTTLLEQYERLTKFAKNGVEEPSYIGSNATVGENIYRGAFSYIGKNSRIGNNVKIHPHVYIGENVTIGNNVIIYAGVKICDGTEIGNHCTIQCGAVIGSDGFGFAPQADGTYKTIPQVGKVILNDFVDVGANTVIDRATMGQTIIGQGSKLDNLIQIAHNVEIGKNTVIAAQAGISGSTTIGESCMIGGQVGIMGHITIADRVNIAAQTGVAGPLDEVGKNYMGSPHMEMKPYLRAAVIYRKLPEMMRRIQELESRIPAGSESR